MNKYNFVIGIDPDVTASGVAVLGLDGHLLRLSCEKFVDVLAKMRVYKHEVHEYDKTLVVIEAGHLLRSNWHLPRVCSANKAAAMGEAVGRCHEVGILLAEMARAYRLDVVEQPPLRKCWSGKDGKITHEEMRYIVECEGYTLPNRTNQEERDALLLAWNAARLPIRVKAMGRKTKP